VVIRRLCASIHEAVINECVAPVSNSTSPECVVHDKIMSLIGTWRITRENSVTTKVEWDSLGQLIRKASVS
jgi:hypothetical protein